MIVFPAQAGIQKKQTWIPACAGKTKKRRESIEIKQQMFKTIHQYYVYILASKKNGTLYIGMTNDLETRVLQHKQKINEGFTLNGPVSKEILLDPPMPPGLFFKVQVCFSFSTSN